MIMETGEGMEKDEMDIKNINIQREATVKRGETANERFIPIEVIGRFSVANCKRFLTKN